jgi:mercuric ion transport protein
MLWLIKIFDKSVSLGAIVAAMGCASCFPALGALGASLGLGFLAQFENLLINTLLPVFAWIVIVSNTLSFILHRIWFRLLIGIVGPVLVLLTLYPLWTYGWSTYLFYAGLALMLVVSIVDIKFPPEKTCGAQKSSGEIS